MDFLPLLVFFIVILMLIIYSNRANLFFYKLLKTRKGEDSMATAEMITDLVGKNVKISDMILGRVYQGVILEIEDKWLKIDVGNPKKETHRIKILSVESIGSVDVM